MNLAKLTPNHLIAFFLGSICFGLFIYSGRNGLQAIAKSLSVDETAVVSSSIFLNKKGIDDVLSKIGEEKIIIEVEKQELPVIQDSEVEEKEYPKNIEIINSSGVNGAALILSKIFDEKKTNILLKNGEEILDETKVFYKNGYMDWKTEIDNNLVEMGFPKAVYEEFEEDLELRIIVGRKVK